MVDLLPIWMVLALVVLLFTGYPVALVLVGVTAVFTAVAIGLGIMAPVQLSIFSLRVYGLIVDNLIFPAVPPLIFMGLALARSGQVATLFAVIGHLLRSVPGCLPITALLIGVLLAPTAGLIGAAVGLLTVVTLPPMLAQGYPPSVASASVAAAGSLGVILPPAIMLFFLADLAGTPIMGAFSGILLPAALLLTGYFLYFAWRGGAPATVLASVSPSPTRGRALLAVAGPIFVIASVLTSIALGWATPSQSGSFGALAAFALMAVTRTLTWPRLKDILTETAYVTAMVFLIIIAANMFSFVFRYLDGDGLIARFLASLGLGDWGTLLFILALIFLLGFFIDWLEIVLITLPIFVPVIEKLDFAAHVGEPMMVKVWIATLFALVLQTSFLTPPFGFALFFVRGAAPPSVTMSDIYRGIVPIVLIQLCVVALVLMLPRLTTVLPQMLIN
ncbi:MAG: TRAP transporter large permease subunit [Pseudomonadota bacterium]